MRIIFLVTGIFLINTLNAQQCVPNSHISATLYRPFKNTTGGTMCFLPNLWASDTAYTVVSYKMTLFPVDDSVNSSEIDGIGNRFQGAARRLFSEAKTGDIISFTCIKAKHQNGKLLTLQPFNIQF